MVGLDLHMGIIGYKKNRECHQTCPLKSLIPLTVKCVKQIMRYIVCKVEVLS